MATCETTLNHRGIRARASRAYANEHRLWPPYVHLFYQLLDRWPDGRDAARKFRFKHTQVSLDLTALICASAS